MPKRARYADAAGDIIMSGPKRPVEKGVFAIARDITNVQTNNTVVPALSAGQAATLDGIKGMIDLFVKDATGTALIVIYLVRETATQCVLACPTTPAANIVSSDLPQQNILWHGYWTNNSLGAGSVWHGTIMLDIKTKRKLQSGDTIKISSIASVADWGQFSAVWSYFLKK